MTWGFSSFFYTFPALSVVSVHMNAAPWGAGVDLAASIWQA
jgi:hypothetical protein